MRFTIAVLSSGTAATLIFTIGSAWVRQGLSVVSAVLAIYSSVSGTTKPVERMSRIMRACTAALIEYEDLWARLESSQDIPNLAESIKQVRQKLADEGEEASHFEKDDDLLEQCQAAVKRSRGL
jgi:hypothetical protein